MNKIIQALQQRIKKADEAYAAGNPVMSDAEYDALWLQYEKIGGAKRGRVERTADGKVVYKTTMNSLTVVKTIEDLKKRFAGYTGRIVFTPKADGLALSVGYANGRLAYAALRSEDYTVGQEVTRNAEAFVKRYVEDLADKEFFEVRGECVLPVSAWLKHFPDLKNPRNGAVGMIKREGAFDDCRHLVFLPYGIPGSKPDDNSYNTELCGLARLLGEAVPILWCGCLDDITEELLEELDRKRKALDYWTDGVVARAEDNDWFEAAGMSGVEPRGATAFKYPPESMETVVVGMDYRVGATGRIVPRALLDPVKIAGTTVTYATLHNFEKVKEHGLCIGDTVELVKAGEIIPYIKRKVKAGDVRQPIEEPKVCPSCGGKLVREETEEGEGIHLCCSNPSCRSRLAGQIRRWCKYHRILNMGDALAEKLAADPQFRTLADLYDWMGDATSVAEQKVVKALQAQAKEEMPLEVFLASCSIPTVNDNKGLKLAETFRTVNAVLNASEAALVACLGAAGKKVYAYLRNPDMDLALDDLADCVQAQPFIPKTKVEGLIGIAITGKLSRTKDHFADLMAKSGKYEYHDPMTKATQILVCADPGSGSAKLQKAAKNGVKVISEAELLELLKP